MNKEEIIKIFNQFPSGMYIRTLPDDKRVHAFFDNSECLEEALSELDEDTTFTMTKKEYKDLKGDLVVEIKNGRVRLAEETSKNNICSLQGWEDRAGRPLVCLPNYVMVIIEGYEVTDSDFEM